MRQVIWKMAIWGDKCSSYDFGGEGLDLPSPPEMAFFLLHRPYAHDLSQLSLHLQEKSEPMELARFEHGNCNF